MKAMTAVNLQSLPVNRGEHRTEQAFPGVGSVKGKFVLLSDS